MLKKDLLYDTLLKKLIKYKNKYIYLKNQDGGKFGCKDLIDNKLGFNNRIGTCWNIVIQTILFFNKNFGDEFQTKLLASNPTDLVDAAVEKLELFLPCKLLNFDNKLLPENRALLIRIIEGIKNRFTIKQTDFDTPARKILPILERQNSMECERSFAKDYFELFGIERKSDKKLHGTSDDYYLLTNVLSIIILGKFIDINVLTEKNDTDYTKINIRLLDDPSLFGIIIHLKRDEVGHAMGFFTCSDGTNILVNNANIIEFNYKNLLKRMNTIDNYNLYYYKTQDTKSIVIIEEKIPKPQLDKDRKYYVTSMNTLKIVDESKIHELLVRNLEYYNTIDTDNIHRFMSKIGILDPKFKIFETIENQNIAQINEELTTTDINIKGYKNITLLNKAISTKNTEIVTIILAREPNIDELNELLICLINKGTVEIFNITLEYILTKIPNINVIKVNKQSLLSYAIDIGRIEIIEIILARRPTIDTSNFMELLIKSIETKNEGIVHIILEKIKEVVTSRILDNNQILKSAIISNNINIVEEIIKIVTINERNFDELLELSINVNNTEIIKKILELGSEYIENKLKIRPVDKNNFNELLEFSIKTKGKKIIEEILIAGLALGQKVVNIKDITTFLKKAIDENFVDFVDIILRLFPKIKKVGNVPILFYALEKDKLDIVNKILEYPDNIDEIYESISILIFAIRKKEINIINKIISLQSNPNLKAKDKLSKTPLIYAIETNDLNVIKTILSARPDINLTDKTSKSALMYAIETNNLDIVNAILTADPKLDINAINNEGETILEYALDSKNPLITKAILDQNPEITDLSVRVDKFRSENPNLFL